ncbi:MAG: substrate-binding domain-containing protein [Spirochaetes bacterium]|nr:substrate-binding domain-containing protein [Spirochaetota bacterium]
MATYALYLSGNPFDVQFRTKLYRDIANGFADACEKCGIPFEILDGRTPLDEIRTAARRYDGICGMLGWHSPAVIAAWKAAASSMPSVSIMSDHSIPGCSYVGVDEDTALGLLVDHLIDEGHASIGFFTVDASPYALERYRAYTLCMERAGRPVHQKHVFGIRCDSGRPDASIRAYHKKLNDYPERYRKKIHGAFSRYFSGTLPSAVIYPYHMDAVFAAAYLRDAGIRVPEDVAIAGIDVVRSLAVKFFPGGITSTEQNVSAVGSRAVAVLNAMLSQKKRTAVRSLLAPRLFVRRSSLKRSCREFTANFRAAVEQHVSLHYADDTVKDDLLAITGLSGNYFLEKFSREFGVTFGRWITDYRAAKAAGLLKNSTLPAKEIMRRTGFGSFQRFSAAFKRSYGMTAEVFRRSK